MAVFGIGGFILGILLLVVGIFLFLFFPAASEHQPKEFTLTGIVLGVLFLIIGGILIFV